MNIRKPAVANYFYPGRKEELYSYIKELFESRLGAGMPFSIESEWDKKLVATIVPHAGYMYSGYTATFSYRKIAEHGNPKTFVIIGPNHTGLGNDVSVYPEGFWETPLGKVEINKELSKKMVEGVEKARFDENAHLFEHSIEVQLPFLQFFFGNNFNFVAVCLKDQSYNTALELAGFLSSLKEDFILIASSDLNHYEPQRETYEKDLLAIRAIESLNTKEFYRILERFNITACGYGAIATAIEFSKNKKAKPFILDHRTSGDVGGDFLRTVGYLSAIFER